MANNLPDEIISEILSPALKVSDTLFADTSDKSPFAEYSESSSAFLLVSKAWLRVATPLLYHVVVLRSKGQAHALQIALSKNPELGRFIKKLRVEGGYGASMGKIIEAAPNVTDLFLSLNIWSADNVSGLCRGLPLMNPARVVLHDLRYRRTHNKNSLLLLDTLKQCIKQWKILNVFELPFNMGYTTTASATIISALSEAPHLKTVAIPASQLYMYGQQPPESLRLLAKNSSLQSIQLKDQTGRIVSPQSHASVGLINHPILRGLIEIPDDDATIFPHVPTEPSLSAKSIQFSTAAVTENIWKRILSFAMALDVEDTKKKTKPESRLGIILVSKMFARLGLPYFYDTLLFSTHLACNNFLGSTDSNESPGRRVKTLYLNTPSVDLRGILTRTELVNIIGLIPFTTTPKVFSDLAKFSGPTLVRLEGIYVTKASKLEKPSLFSLFPRISSLSAAFKAPFNETLSLIPSGALATLERLTLSSFHESLVVVLSHMDLLSLRHAAFPNDHAGLRAFLEKHGDKLLTLTVSLECTRRINVFDLCPVVVDLTVNCGNGIPDPANFTSTSERMSLETITFTTEGRLRGVEKKWGTFFQSLNIRTFPALQQISVPCITWPTTEHDISKSLWVKWAEELLDRNVKLVDRNGVGWRRRLKK
ncbi:hypothetical protein FB451DRAFT_1263206 [Mycena latifolia]|nr:hypothetical protein FB451DRAFT_1263206 [Mycena latifolia]